MDGAVDAVGGALGVVAREVHRLGDLHVGLVDQLAHLVGGHRDECRPRLLELGREPAQRRCPRGGPNPSPQLAGPTSTLKDGLDSGGRRRGRMADQGCPQPRGREKLLDGGCPLLVRPQRWIRVRRVGEPWLVVGARLGGPPLRGGSRDQRDRLPEPHLLPVEERGVAAEVRRARHEVLRGRVLLQAADQVGDGRVELGARHHRNIEPEAPDLAQDDPLQRHPHAGEHLDVHLVRHAPGARHLPRRGKGVHVVAGDADEQAPGALGGEAEVHGAQKARVGLRLAPEHRALPPPELGLDALHGQVGALDQPHLDRHASRGHPPRGQLIELPQDQARLREIGLHRDPGV